MLGAESPQGQSTLDAGLCIQGGFRKGWGQGWSWVWGRATITCAMSKTSLPVVPEKPRGAAAACAAAPGDVSPCSPHDGSEQTQSSSPSVPAQHTPPGLPVQLVGPSWFISPLWSPEPRPAHLQCPTQPGQSHPRAASITWALPAWPPWRGFTICPPPSSCPWSGSVLSPALGLLQTGGYS